MDVFPLGEGADYSYQRAWTSKHHGTDIFASRGQPVVAVSPGHARAATDPKGGKVVYLKADDGWNYYYAHLDSWEPVLAAAGIMGVDVDAGSMLGQVGNTGNAKGKATHIHFQAAKPGGGAVDPFDLLRAVDPRRKQTPALPKGGKSLPTVDLSGAGALVMVFLLARALK